MPDFQNWVEFFADEVVFEQEIQVLAREEEPEKDGKAEKKPKG